MDAFAIYRLPKASRCTLVGQDGVPSSFFSLSELGDDRGFVITPFHVGDALPILLVRPDVIRQCSPDEVLSMNDLPYHLDGKNLPVQPADREDYHDDFCRFHRAFSETGLQKLVLARSEDISHDGTDPARLFARACNRYPDAFVTLFSAPQCGTWLIATPEVLLARDKERWHTMALAGTMPYNGNEEAEWSDKNKREQAFVSQYINNSLGRYSNDVSVKGPYTVRAGNLVHLRTDFSFSMSDDSQVEQVLDELHPTPAVCGQPKQEAHRFIMENETCDRSYYSGFSGPLDVNGTTAMYVSLRCMRIFDDHYRLYAGGGILAQSEESLEWDETVFKMQAMLSIINERHEL